MIRVFPFLLRKLYYDESGILHSSMAGRGSRRGNNKESKSLIFPCSRISISIFSDSNRHFLLKIEPIHYGDRLLCRSRGQIVNSSSSMSRSEWGSMDDETSNKRKYKYIKLSMHTMSHCAPMLLCFETLLESEAILYKVELLLLLLFYCPKRDRHLATCTRVN